MIMDQMPYPTTGGGGAGKAGLSLFELQLQYNREFQANLQALMLATMLSGPPAEQRLRQQQQQAEQHPSVQPGPDGRPIRVRRRAKDPKAPVARASTLLEVGPDAISAVVLSVAGVVAWCRKRVDLSLLRGTTANVCLDGTSCTKKTAILHSTGRTVRKTSQLGFSSENTDSHGTAMLGHFCLGLYDMLAYMLHFRDRAPGSAHWWHLLWIEIGKIRQRYGLDHFPEEAIRSVREFFETVRKTHIARKLDEHANVIALVDSDLDRCDRLRMARNSSSDAERSRWAYYTPIQNCMYQTLYPGRYIDLAWFGPTPDDVVVRGIAAFLVEVQDELVVRLGAPSGRPPFELRMPPAAGDDVTLTNAKVHQLRMLARRQHPVKETAATTTADHPTVDDPVWDPNRIVPVDDIAGFELGCQVVNGICAKRHADDDDGDDEDGGCILNRSAKRIRTEP